MNVPEEIFRGKRLLFVVNEAFFFVSHRLALAQAAAQQGFEVHVAAPEDNVWAPEGFCYSEIERLGFTFHTLRVDRRGMNPFTDLGTLVALVRLYRSLRPTLVQHITIKPVLYGGIAARVTSIPGVLNLVTGLGQVFVGKGLGYRALRFAVVQLYRFAAGHQNQVMMFQNHGDRDRLVAERVVANTATDVVPGSGVDLVRFTPRDEPVDERKIVVLPGRMLWEKGVEEFVAMARRLKERGCTARFVLLGGTTDKSPAAVPVEAIEDWVSDGHIEWWGRSEEMELTLAMCSIVCLPTYYGEGVPKVLLEAMALARAVVAADVPGCREVVIHEKNGLLVPPRDEVLLANAVIALLEDPGRRCRLGSEARKTVESGFSEQAVVDRTFAVYEKLLTGNPNA